MSGEGQLFFLFSRALLEKNEEKNKEKKGMTDNRSESGGWLLISVRGFSQHWLRTLIFNGDTNSLTHAHLPMTKRQTNKRGNSKCKIDKEKCGIHYSCPTTRWTQTHLCSLTSQLPLGIHVTTPVQPSHWFAFELSFLLREAQGIAGAVLIVIVLWMHSECCCCHNKLE